MDPLAVAVAALVAVVVSEHPQLAALEVLERQQQ
jgi:hypothetical protein